MTKGYWCAVFAIGLSVCVATPATSGKSSQAPKPVAAHNVGVTKAAEKVSAQASIAPPTSGPGDANKKPIEADPKFPSFQSSVWTNWIQAISAAFSAIAACFLWWLSRRQTHIMRQNAEDTASSVSLAKQSADAAKKLAEVSQWSAENELRAWLNVTATLSDCGRTAEAAHFTVDATVENIGKTPATDIEISVHVTCKSSIATKMGNEDWPKPIVSKYPHQLRPLLPGCNSEHKEGVRLSNEQIKAGKASIIGRPTIMVEIDIVAFYKTAFDLPDAPKRRASIRYRVFPRQERPYPDMEWLDKAFSLETVIWAQDKSAYGFMD